MKTTLISEIMLNMKSVNREDIIITIEECIEEEEGMRGIIIITMKIDLRTEMREVEEEVDLIEGVREEEDLIEGIEEELLTEEEVEENKRGNMEYN